MLARVWRADHCPALTCTSSSVLLLAAWALALNTSGHPAIVLLVAACARPSVCASRALWWPVASSSTQHASCRCPCLRTGGSCSWSSWRTCVTSAASCTSCTCERQHPACRPCALTAGVQALLVCQLWWPCMHVRLSRIISQHAGSCHLS